MEPLATIIAPILLTFVKNEVVPAILRKLSEGNANVDRTRRNADEALALAAASETFASRFAKLELELEKTGYKLVRKSE